jgi:hypothetical protein
MFKRKSPQLTKAEALAYIPVKNPEVQESRQGGCALLSYRLPVNPLVRGLGNLLSKRAPDDCLKKLELDVMGTHVWDAINGSRTVAQLTVDFVEKFHITHSEAEASVSAFLRELGRRQLIALGLSHS